MDHNLRYAILDYLKREKLFQFDKETFFKEQLHKTFSSLASYNYRPYERTEAYLQSIDLSGLPLAKVEELDWSGASGIVHDIWKYWDGEDEYFHIESLAGIEVCPNVKEIKVEYLWKVTDLSPLARLINLESLVIWSQPVEPIESLAPLLAIDTLKDVCLEGVEFRNSEETEKIIMQLKEKGVEVEIEI